GDPRAGPVVLAAGAVVGEGPDLHAAVGGDLEPVVGSAAGLVPGAVAHEHGGNLDQGGRQEGGDGGGDPVGIAGEQDPLAVLGREPELGAVAGDMCARWSSAHRWRSFREWDYRCEGVGF